MLRRVSRAVQQGAAAIRRRLSVAPVAVLAALLLVAGGAVVGALATAPGHALARRVALGALADAVNGRVSVGRLGGKLWRAFELDSVELAGADGRSVISLERARARYALVDLLRGRYVLSRVELVRPVLLLEQDEGGGWNIERLFPGGDDPGGGGRRPLVELRAVRVVDGTLIVRRRVEGRVDERVVHGLSMELARVRASHPESSAVSVALRRLEARLSEPDLRITNARGSLAIDADSLRLDLDPLELPASRAALAVRVRWGGGGGGGTSAEVAVSARRLAFADVAALDARLPGEGGGSFAARLSLPPGGGARIEVRELEMATGRSRVSGSARVAVGARGGVSIGAMDLALEPLDLALLTPLLGDDVPRGVVRGAVAGSGTPDALDVDARLTWTDEAVSGGAVNVVNGRGRLAFGGESEFAFQGFALAGASLDLATVRRYAPPVSLAGRVGLTGRLEGPWREARFGGSLTHTHAPRAAATRLFGSLLLTLRDTVKVDADLTADSLSLDLLAASYPAIPLRGMAAGQVRVRGPVDSLDVEAWLEGPAGGASGQVRVVTRDSLVTVAGDGTLERADLSGHRGGLPPTSLVGDWVVRAVVPRGSGDSAGPVTGTAQVSLRESRVAGLGLRRAGFSVSATAGRMVVDSASAVWPGGSAMAFGALGRPGQPPGQLAVAVRSDTLARLAPLFGWVRSAVGDSGAGPAALDGAGELRGTLVGTLSEWEWTGTVNVGRASLRGTSVLRLAATGRVKVGAAGPVLALEVRADSLSIGGLAYGPVSVSASGAPDSLALRAAAGFALGSVRAALAYRRDSAGAAVDLDSLRLALPESSWRLAARSRVAVSSDSVWIRDSLVLRAKTGWLRASGSLPRAAVGAFSLAADSLRLSDLYALAQRDTTGVGGLVNFAAQLAGPAARPLIQVGVGLDSGRFGEFRAPRLDVLARYSERRLSFKGGLWRGAVRVVALGGSLPLDLSLSPVAQRLLPDSLLLTARSDSVDLSVVDAITRLVRDVRGSVDGEIMVAGTWDEPRVSGYVVVSGGSVRVPALGVRYGGIAARLDLEGDRIRVTRARLVSDGTLDVSGEVRLERRGRPRLDLTLEARGFTALNLRDFAGVTGSGALSLRGPLLGATLAGRLAVDAGFLAFADLVEKRIVSLDDPEFRAIVDSNLARAAGLAPEFQSVFLDSLRISNLTVAMGPDVWLRSSEANIQLAGEFQTAKTVESGLERYRLDGTLRAVRGTYRLELGPVSREFRVTRGTVRFFGTPDLDPELDIAAEHQLRTLAGGQLVVRALIGGSLRSPRLTLESDQRPPLSETDVVSYLIFGQPASELSGGGLASGANRAAIVANAIASFTAGQLGQTLVTELGLPIDYVAIRPGGGNNGGGVGEILSGARVEAGKQLSERTFLTLNAGLCEVRRGGTSQLLGATIEYRLARRLTFEASLEPLVRECRETGPAAPQTSRYQIGLDLFWLLGVP